jgi:hypothetical protein
MGVSGCVMGGCNSTTIQWCTTQLLVCIAHLLDYIIISRPTIKKTKIRFTRCAHTNRWSFLAWQHLHTVTNKAFRENPTNKKKRKRFARCAHTSRWLIWAWQHHHTVTNRAPRKKWPEGYEGSTLNHLTTNLRLRISDYESLTTNL